jgi:hypothetical protein
LPEGILAAASAADAIREGPRGSAWFAHRDWTGILTGVEMRGPTSSRVAVCEDALSLAAIESRRRDTLYTATTGGMSPATIAALQQLLEGLASEPAGTLIAATDADIAGRRYAARLQRMATDAGVRFDAILPPDGLNDWNDTLRTTTPTSLLA